MRIGMMLIALLMGLGALFAPEYAEHIATIAGTLAVGTVLPYLNKANGAVRVERNSIQYNPAITSSGAGVIAVNGDALATRSPDDGSLNPHVRVALSFSFTPAVAGTPETISVTLPTDATAITAGEISADGYVRRAAFSSTNQAFGTISGGDAADFVLPQITSENAGLRVQFAIDQTTAGAVRYGLVFEYELAN